MNRGQGGGGARWSRPLLFAFILACHALLILLAPRGLIHLPHGAEAPLLIFMVTPRPRSPIEPPHGPSSSWQRSVPAAHSPAAMPPILKSGAPEALPAPAAPLYIDWAREAVIAAQHQTDSSAAGGPRSLDDHPAGKPRAGLNSRGAYQFGWDYAATHRIDTTQGVPVIHLSDRCAVAFLLILPNFACGFGAKIPANGELFKHMHESP